MDSWAILSAHVLYSPGEGGVRQDARVPCRLLANRHASVAGPMYVRDVVHGREHNAKPTLA
jgi:hypothetical protein